jgi:DNA adenine methylase
VTRPALRYFGGKWKIAEWICRQMPAHDVYVEPFGGAGSVMLRKTPSRLEVYNDLDGDVVNFFRVLRDRPDALIRAVALTPYSREEHVLAQAPTEEPLERARRFYVLCWQSYASGTRPKPFKIGWRTTKAYHAGMMQSWCDEENLYAIAARLKQVLIENNDAFALLKSYDSPATLFYVDPPYLGDTRSGHGRNEYRHEMYDAESHRRLAAALHGVQGKVMLSGYESALYDGLYADWTKVARSVPDKSHAVRMECVWLSPGAERVQLSLFDGGVA